MVAVYGDDMVTVLSLNSGVPQLTIDVGMRVQGFGVIEDTVVVIGKYEVYAWTLPAVDFAPGARVDRKDRLWMASFINSCFGPRTISVESISLDTFDTLYIYNTSNGQYLKSLTAEVSIPQFSLDGLKVWCALDSSLHQEKKRTFLQHYRCYRAICGTL